MKKETKSKPKPKARPKSKRSIRSKIWADYRPLSDTVSILSGNFSLNHQRFAYKSKGHQSVAVCLMAVLFSKLEKIQNWTANTLDTILTSGDSFYLKMLLKDTATTMRANRMPLALADIIEHPIYLGPYKFLIDRSLAVVQDRVSEPHVLGDCLRAQPFSTVILAVQKYYFAVFKIDGFYCLFDAIDRDRYGNPAQPNCGSACVLRFANLEIFSRHFCCFLKIDRPVFKLFPIRIGRVSKLEADSREVAVDLSSLNGSVPATRKKSRTKKSNSICSDSASLTGSLEMQRIDECSSLDREGGAVAVKNVLCSLLNDKTFHAANEINCLQDRELGTINYRILRASRYDRDSSCLSALVMLQCHRMKFWTSSVLDRVLAIPISSVHEPIECENKRFLIESQTVRIVGRLVSKNDHVFDFEHGIEAFFKTHDMGLIEGPLNVAVWVENEKVFMWNRENCNDYGIRVAGGGPDSETGTACLLEFCRIGDLVAIYFASVGDENRSDFFMIRPINIHYLSFMPDNWNAFIGLKNKRYWILRGQEHRSTSEIVNQESCAIYALAAYKYTENFADWTSDTIDSIVRDSGELKDCVVFPYLDKEAHVEIERNVRCADFHESDGQRLKAEVVLENALASFFATYDLGFIVANDRTTFCLIKSRDFFYLINCFESNENGVKSTNGTCCILRTPDIKQLVALLVPNIDLVGLRACSLNAVRIEFWQIDETDGVGIPRCLNFESVELENGPFRRGFAILRASCLPAVTASKVAADQWAIMTCFCAVAMSKLFPSLNWSSAIMDEITRLGNELFSQRYDPNDCGYTNVAFEIGCNEFSMEPQVLQSVDGVFSLSRDLGTELERDEESNSEVEVESELVDEFEEEESNELSDSDSIETGSVELGSLQVDSLDQSLHRLFASFPNFVLVSEKWTVVFWSENGLIYLYDPKDVETGTASLMLFANFERLGQFLQVPVAANQNHTFKLIPIDIRISLPVIERDLEPWHRFRCVRAPIGPQYMWILRGSVSRNDEIFPEQNRGNQSFFDCLICLCFVSTCAASELDTSTIDLILFYGDRLFSVKESLADAEDNAVVAKVIKSFSLKHLKVHCNIKRNVVAGDLQAGETDDVLDLKRAVKKIEDEQPEKFLAIVHLKNDHCAVFKSVDSYFLFDSDSCSPTGLRTTFGKAAITRHSSLETLQVLLAENMRNREGSDQFSIDVVELVLKEELNFYREVLREFSLAEITAMTRPQTETRPSVELLALHATLSQDSDCFGRLEHSACAANCVSVFVMQQFRKTSTWTERILDEILTFADRELYERSRPLQQADESGQAATGDHKLRLECLINDFEFQSHQVHFDLLHDSRMVGTWRKNVTPILYMLEEFFQKGFRYGAFKCSLLFAIWKEELYYLFDPHSKHKLDDVMGQYLGTPTCAYLLGFKTIEALAEFLLVTIPDSVQNGTEFELLPLDFSIAYPKVATEVAKTPVTDCNYSEIDSELSISILHGSCSLYADKYGAETCGRQIYTVSVMASVISILRNPRTWTSEVIDDVLDIGTTLYEMIRSRDGCQQQHQQLEDGTTMLLGFESIVRSLKNCDAICELIQKQGTVREICENTVIEIFKARLQHDLSFNDLVDYLNEWFVSESHAIIEKKVTYSRPGSISHADVNKESVKSIESLGAKPEREQEFELETHDVEPEMEQQEQQFQQPTNEIMRIFCITIVKNSQEFYLFDPYCRDSHGNAIEVGRACVLKCGQLRPLLEKFLANTYRSSEFETFAETVTYSIFTTDLKNL